MTSTRETDVLILGAGLAGLQCARDLVDAGLDVMVCEAQDGVGGRIRTDRVDGFLVDRGFQLLNPAYPAVRRLIDVDALQLQRFGAGAAVRTHGGLEVLADPFRAPRFIGASLRAVGAHPRELVALARWMRPVLSGALRRRSLAAHLTHHPDPRTLRQSLDEVGLDGLLRMVMDRFLTGTLLDDSGMTSADFARLLVKTFVAGTPGLPHEGMQALPEQVAAALGERVHLQCRVDSVTGSLDSYVVKTAVGTVRARHVVVATSGVEAERLTGMVAPASKGVVTEWYAAPMGSVPIDPAMLYLDGGAGPPGPLVNAVVISAAAPSYAPAGSHLVAASALMGGHRTTPTSEAMRRHASELLGVPDSGWQLVRRHEIPDALPVQPPPLSLRRTVQARDGLIVCGDHRDTGSIQGALVSGGRAAAAVLATR